MVSRVEEIIGGGRLHRVAFVEPPQIPYDAHIDECEYESGREENQAHECRHVELRHDRRTLDVAVFDGLTCSVVAAERREVVHW